MYLQMLIYISAPTAMEEEMLKRLVKSRNVLKKKFQSIKMGEEAKTTELKNTFKPITEPINKLLKLSTENTSKMIMPKKEKMEMYRDSIITSTPLKNYKPDVKLDSNALEGLKHRVDYTQNFDSFNTTQDDDKFYSNNEEPMNLSFLKKIKKLDVVYGPHKDNNGEWRFGDQPLKISNEKIMIGNKNWALTPGLFELLFYQDPKNYDHTELDIYKTILLDTNAHKINYESNGRIKSNRGQKYKKIIKNIIEDTHSGKGLLTINPGKPNYIYWDDPNELIERLKLLLASQQAGNNNHTNEIVSIIEELREGNIIY
ncbi:uncharacterized protein LOC131805847 [Musca domestica]|uniref:Uncharacterized protein LOC131805847 n=1 Tax=Musca domestica TaxID=7370 RepID=A0ABM3VIA9_MUSDO|nr:uncharacterized protein LOC131805847 [Musca domestica]